MAKSKTKPKPRGNPKTEGPSSADDSPSAKSHLPTPVKGAKPAKDIEPVKSQPWGFRLSLALFVCWLLYLSYVAFVVLLK